MAERLLCIYSRKVLVAHSETWETEIQFMEVVRKKKKKNRHQPDDVASEKSRHKAATSEGAQKHWFSHTRSSHPDLRGIPQQIVPQFVLTELLHRAVPPALLPFPPPPCPCSRTVALTR